MSFGHWLERFRSRFSGDEQSGTPPQKKRRPKKRRRPRHTLTRSADTEALESRVLLAAFWQDDFEMTSPELPASGSNRNAKGHTSTTDGQQGTGDHSVRDIPGTDAGKGFGQAFTGHSGSLVWRFEDMDGLPLSNPGEIEWTGIDISGRSNLLFAGLFGARFGGFLEAGDFITVAANVDSGGYTTLLDFQHNGGNVEETVSGTDLTLAMQEFTASITAGNSLDLRVQFFSDGGGDEMAFDNFRIGDNNDVSLVTGPEISVTGEGMDIADGDTTPTTVDDTDFGSREITGEFVEHTFTINNTGGSTLNLSGTPIVDITGAGASHFTVTDQPAATVADGGSDTFTIRFDPSAIGTHTATVSIANDDSDENPFNFDITGEGLVDTTIFWQDDFQGVSPELPAGGSNRSAVGHSSTTDGQVFDAGGDFSLRTAPTAAGANAGGATPIAGPIGAGEDFTGASGSHIWRVEDIDAHVGANAQMDWTGIDITGITDLKLEGLFGARFGGFFSAGDGFITVQTQIDGGGYTTILDFQPSGGNLVGSGETLTLALTEFEAAIAGTGNALDVRVLFDSHGGGDELAFDNFRVRGVVPMVPEINLSGNGMNIADGDTTPQAADDTDFGQAQIGGQTQVHTFTITNTGNAALDLTGSPLVDITGAGASHFSVTAQPSTDPVPASGGMTTFEITFDPSAIGVQTATVSIASDDSDENPFNFDITGEGIADAPEISVSGLGIEIVDGDTTPSTSDDTDFGDVNVTGGTNSNVFTVTNQGFALLQLDNGGPQVVISGTHASDFTVTADALPLVASNGATTTFTIEFDPSSTGLRTATVTIPNNDADENPYTFDIQGFGRDTPFWTDDFESTAPSEGVRNLPNHTDNATEMTDGEIYAPGDHFVRTNNPSLGDSATFTGVSGFYWAAQDIDGGGSGFDPDTINWTGITITGRENLVFSGLFGAEMIPQHEGTDQISILADIDGGGFNEILRFAEDGSGFMAVDTDLDGTGDGAVLSTALQEFTAPISGTGNSLSLRLIATQISGEEEVAWDNFNVEGNQTFTPSDVLVDGSGNLLIDDADGDVDDDLTIRVDGTNYRISDAAAVLAPGSGASNDGGDVLVPVASVTGSIIVTTRGGDDTLTIDFSGGNFTDAIMYQGGANTGTGDDIVLTGGGTFADAMLGFVNENDGSIDITGNQTISYTGLEPVALNINATNVTLNYSTTAETITVSDAGSGQTQVDSDVAAEMVTFNNPTGTLTINAGDTGVNTIDVGTLAASYPASIDINGGNGGDTVNLNGGITFAADRSLTVDAQTINAPTTGSDIATSGMGSVGLTATRSIVLGSGSSLGTVNGGITLAANMAGTSTGDFDGVDANNASIQTTGTGNIQITGRGSDTSTSDLYGIRLHNGSTVSSTATGASAGTITLDGTGGNGTLNNTGVFLTNSMTAVTSVDGDVSITGQGSGTTTNNYGVLILNGARVQTTGTGAQAAGITIDGTGGSGTNTNYGVFLSNSTPAVQSTDGDISITGVSTTGDVGIRSEGSVTSTLGDIGLHTDDIQIGSAIGSGGTLLIQPETTSASIGVGTGATGTLNLDATELGFLQDGFSSITIGDAAAGSGAVDVNDSTFTDPITIVGGTIAANGLNAGSNDATLTARTGAITDGGSGTDVTGGAVDLGAAGNIGSMADPLDTAATDLSSDTSGANGSQWINEADGLTGLDLNAGTGNVELHTMGSVLDSDGSTDITATSALANLATGDFGGAGNPIHTDVDDLTVTTGEGGQHISEIDGLSAIDLEASSTANIDLQAGGAVLDGDMDVDVMAGGASISAGGDIGTPGTGLHTDLDNFEAASSGGGVEAHNTGGLTIGGVNGLTGVNATGAVDISASSPLTVSEDVISAGDITLTATDSASTGDNLHVSDGVTIRSTGGQITLNAGDDFSVGTGTTLDAANQLIINIDNGDADGGTGASAVLGGTVMAGEGTTVNGAGDADTVNASAISAAVTMNGGGGNDSLTGGTSADQINGGVGNDEIVGGQGNDNLNGGDDDDLFTWNNGDGSDNSRGDAGNDRQVVNGANNASEGDDITVSVVATNLEITRAAGAMLGGFTIDVEGIETIDVNSLDGADTLTVEDLVGVADLTQVNLDGGEGADTFNVEPSDVASVDVTGGNPTMGPGDTLNFTTPPGQSSSVTPSGVGAGTISATGGFQDVDFTGIEALSFGGDELIVNTGDEDDLIDVSVTGTGAGTLDLTQDVDGMPGPTQMFEIMFTGVERLRANGEGGDDVFRLTSSGAVMGLMNGIEFNGGAGSDSVELTGGTATSVEHGFANATDGSITIDGFGLAYTGLEPILDTITATDRIFTFAGTDDDITLTDLGGGRSRISSVSSSETVDFTNPTGSLTINAGDGNDTLDASTSAIGATVNGGVGDDELTGSPVVDQISGGAGNDQIIGGPGNDVLSGGDDDDLIIWNNGDGSDMMDGDAGNDRVEVNGADNAAEGDQITISDAGGGRTDLTRAAGIMLGGFSLDIGTTETLDVNTQNGSDTVNVQAVLAGTSTNIDAGGGFDFVNVGDASNTLDQIAGNLTVTGGDHPASPSFAGPIVQPLGDSLTINDSGHFGARTTDITATTITRTGVPTINYGTIETLTVNANSTPSTLNLASTPDNANVTINTGVGNDVITVNGTGASNNLVINAGGHNNEVTVLSVGAGSATRVLTGSGNDTVDASSVSENISVSGGAGDDLILGGSGNDELVGGAGNDLMLGGAGNDEMHGNDGNDQIGGGLGEDTVNGGSGNDHLIGGEANRLVKLNTNFGTIEIELFLDIEPNTAGTFLANVLENDYINSIFHRLNPTFVIQGGGFRTNSTTFDLMTTNITGFAANPNLANEGVTVSNTRGTVSTALSPGNPNSFSGQYFISYVDNSGLDAAGHIVFGRVRDMAVVDAMRNSHSPFNVTAQTGNSALGELPLTDTPASGMGELIVVQSIDVSEITSATAAGGVDGVDEVNGGDGNDRVAWADGGAADVLSGDAGTDTLVGRTATQLTVDDTTISDGTSTAMHSGFEQADLAAQEENAGVAIDASSYSNPTTMTGASGNDILDGGSARDEIDARGGADEITGGAGDDMIIGGDGNDEIRGGADNDALFGAGGVDQVNGGDGNDLVHGGGASGDVLTGGRGDDIFTGRGFNEIEEFADQNLFLADGQMTGLGNDTIVGNYRAVTLHGTAGGNVLEARNWSQTGVTMNGGAGNDTQIGTELGDELNGEAGDDRLIGRGGDDSLNGGDDDDFLSGQTGDDRVFGDAGTDFVHGGQGRDSLGGGLGDDSILGAGSNVLTERVATPGGNLTMVGPSVVGFGTDVISAGISHFQLEGDDLANVIDTTGTVGNVTSVLRGGDDMLIAGNGRNAAFGGDGNDTLIGGLRYDTLHGQAGNDAIFGGGNHDVLFGGAGNDIIGGANGLDIIAGDDGDDMITGGEGEDVILGNNGNDTLIGGLQRDVALGGPGDDVISGDTGFGVDPSFDTLGGGAGNNTFNPVEDGTAQIDENFAVNIDQLIADSEILRQVTP